MPQSGNSVSVEAVDPVFQTKMLDMLKQTGRPEMVVGWYHSHPGFGCWFSGTDINTQQSFDLVTSAAAERCRTLRWTFGCNETCWRSRSSAGEGSESDGPCLGQHGGKPVGTGRSCAVRRSMGSCRADPPSARYLFSVVRRTIARLTAHTRGATLMSYAS